MFDTSRDELQSTLGNEFQPLLFENDLKALLPEGFLLIASLLLLLYGVVYSGDKQNRYPLLIHNVSWLAQLTLLLTTILVTNTPLRHGALFYNTLVADDLTFFLKILLLFGAFFSILISIEYVQQESLNSFEMIVLILLSTSSMLLLVSSADLMTMYLTIELQSLCFYVLAAFKRNSEFSTEAGLKYFLLGAFSSGILLFGSSLIYGLTGVTNFSELAQILTGTLEDPLKYSYGEAASEGVVLGITSLRGCELGMILILIGLLFKVSAVPFHMWLPDVYEGAPTSVTALFSILPKVSIFAVFLRIFFEGFYAIIPSWQNLLALCSVASMVLGAFAALSQNKIKRLLAFSSIGHVGYLLVGFCCGTIEGIQALLIYLVVYILMTINLFAIILSPLRRETLQGHTEERGLTEGSEKSFKDHSRVQEFAPASSRIKEGVAPAPASTKVQRVKYTTDFAMLSKSHPVLAATLTITIFSIAGIPPLAGFYSKAFLIFAAVSSSQYVLAVVAVLTSVISCFYYIRIVKIVYFESPTRWLSFMQISKESSIALGLTLSFLLFFLFYPAPLFLATHKVALHLCY